jgi:hypothetical protein
MVLSKQQDNENNSRYHDYLKYKTSFMFLITYYLNRIYETVSSLNLIAYTGRCA